jgi:hypothetical protein
LKSAIRLVACAVHYHIKRRTGERTLDIFDEKLYPLSVSIFYLKLLYISFKYYNSLQRDISIPNNYDKIVPEHRVIYKFMKNLFTAAQLTAECAIVTLVRIFSIC